jgi:putative cell wall-binding protein
VAETAFQTADTVFLALGTNFPDALVAAAAGGHLDAPVLLTGSDSLPAETIAELLRLSPSTVYIVGGTAVISPAVEQEAAHYAPAVKRLAGPNRYDTAVAVSSTVFPTADTAFVAFGENFPDALVGAAAAGHVGAPVLLTSHDQVSAATVAELDRLDLATIYLVGGTAVISDAVALQLAPYGHVVRLAGPDRYATAAAVAKTVFASADYVFLAYGGNFPDALVAAAAGGHLGGPVLLVRHDSIPTPTREQLDRLKPNHVYLVGGTAVIGEAVFAALP